MSKSTIIGVAKVKMQSPSTSPSGIRVFGLTGGIGSGKSTVARMLRELEVEVLDADEISREVVRPGTPALGELIAEFGPDLLQPDGSLDRKALATRVFADPAARARLNAITHPRIGAETQRRIAALGARGIPLVVYEAALLVENGLHRGLDGLIVVAVDETTQLERLRARDGLDDAAARARLAAQAPLSEKVAAATHVIDNGGTIAQTRAQVENLCRQLQRVAP